MNSNETKVWCDPPRGWRYGFPKCYDEEKHPDFNRWLVDEGYPESEIESYGDYFHCRFWSMGEDDED